MTTTPELSREQRDAAMVERYSNGETLTGLLKFTEAQYAAAVSDFYVEMNSEGLKPTVERYDAWAKLEIAAGRNRPSGASVRNIYGTWLDAVRSGQK